MKKILPFIIVSIITCNCSLMGQTILNDLKENKDSIYQNWYNKSPEDDSIYGANVEKAYALLKNKTAKKVIVAVIDGGIDIEHEDLKENIWTNPNEIPGNGIDDDNNGYTDDIYGWNFIGNSKGENIKYENLESTRIYKQLKGKYDEIDPKTLPDEEEDIYRMYIDAKNHFLKEKQEALTTQKNIKKFKENYLAAKVKLEWYLDTSIITLSSLKEIKSEDKFLMQHVHFLKFIYENDFEEDFISEMKDQNEEKLNYHLNPDFNPREIIGDNPEDMNETYGNNDVAGEEPFHGTFVAGIIAAERNNDLGINGIANNVKIMALRLVPNGDERDKDIAKAIYYAVDNGAKIINMSFGKDFSPQKHLVDKAVLYAEKHDVLMIHASGNDGLNLNKTKQYPTKKISEEKNANNWITVGASSDTIDLEFAAIFSNYGKKYVDIFAPGVNIRSLAPENKYEIAEGTSFSAPVVTGVAAMLFSYFPQLTSTDVKDILLNSAYDFSKVKVYLPNKEGKQSKKTKLKKLCTTGGIVNAYNAVIMANKLYEPVHK